MDVISQIQQSVRIKENSILFFFHLPPVNNYTLPEIFLNAESVPLSLPDRDV